MKPVLLMCRQDEREPILLSHIVYTNSDSLQLALSHHCKIFVDLSTNKNHLILQTLDRALLGEEVQLQQDDGRFSTSSRHSMKKTCPFTTEKCLCCNHNAYGECTSDTRVSCTCVYRKL